MAVNDREVRYLPAGDHALLVQILETLRDLKAEQLRIVHLVNKYEPLLEKLDGNPLAKLFLRKG